MYVCISYSMPKRYVVGLFRPRGERNKLQHTDSRHAIIDLLPINWSARRKHIYHGNMTSNGEISLWRISLWREDVMAADDTIVAPSLLAVGPTSNHYSLGMEDWTASPPCSPEAIPTPLARAPC